MGLHRLDGSQRVNCPKCGEAACIGHMICHYCGYRIRLEDLD
jgi:uncharacterized OB-fold protein